MAKLFAPYANDKPVPVEVNGHRLLILTRASEDLVRDLAMLGGEEIREIQFPDANVEESALLADIATDSQCGVVLAPPGIQPSAMIQSLEEELPWIH